jgi:RNA-binding protein
MLTPKQKQYLRGLAHAMKPVVIIGDKGLTESVADETRRALDHHELIKVKVAVGGRVERQAMVADLCTRTGAETVQTLGRMATLFLANPEQPRITLP